MAYQPSGQNVLMVMNALFVLSLHSGELYGGQLHSINADVILIDLGPNLGAINRAALIAADYVAVPLAPDLFSLQGLRNLGPTLQKWRNGWDDRLTRTPK